MKTGEICNRSVIVVDRAESALSAARLMREFHVGDVVIVSSENGKRIPVGIVTDRDLALEIVAQEVEADSVETGDLFTGTRLVTASVDDDLDATLDSMRAHGVRRMPVVDSDGSLAGIITVDDILDEITDELTDIVRLISTQQKREERLR